MYNKIRILHLISSLTRGGRERQLATIVSNIDRERFQTTIVYFNDHEYSYLHEYGLMDYSIKLKSYGKLARLKELHKILKKDDPNIVYTWGNGESISILLLKPFHHYKFINGSLRHGIRSRRLSQYIRTLVLHLSKHVVANSKAGLKANNLRNGYVLYNGLDSKFLEPSSDWKAKRQSLTGIKEDILLLVSVGNLVPYKDYFTILRAFKQLKEEGYKFYYFILGDGPMRQAIEEIIKDFNLNDNVKILGNVENVADYLKVSDIFIHSSKGEGCSNAILEAMAAGLPIIATNVGGVPETVFQKSSLLFPHKDHKALYQCLLKSEELITSFDSESEEYKTHLKKFSVDSMISGFEAIIKKVIEE